MPSTKVTTKTNDAEITRCVEQLESVRAALRWQKALVESLNRRFVDTYKWTETAARASDLSEIQQLLSEKAAKIVSLNKEQMSAEGELEDARSQLAPAIQEALDEQNGRATRNVLDAEDVLQVARDAEHWATSREIPKKLRVGMMVTYRRAGPAKSYRYRMLTNEIRLKRVTDGWRLVEIDKIEVYPGASASTQMSVPVATAEAIRKAAMDRAAVLPARAA